MPRQAASKSVFGTQLSTVGEIFPHTAEALNNLHDLPEGKELLLWIFARPLPNCSGRVEFRRLANKIGLLFQRELQIPIAVLYRGQRGEDATADAKINGAHVRAFFSAFEAESDAAEIGRSHRGGFGRGRLMNYCSAAGKQQIPQLRAIIRFANDRTPFGMTECWKAAPLAPSRDLWSRIWSVSEADPDGARCAHKFALGIDRFEVPNGMGHIN